MDVVILAAGYGTRMYPLTKDRPKALLEVSGRSIIDYILDKIRPLNVNRVFVVTNNRFYSQFLAWRPSEQLEIVNDGTNSNDDRLGGIGDLNFVIKKFGLDDDMLVVSSDNIFTSDLSGFVGFFKKQGKTSVCLYELENLEDAKRFGVVELKGRRVVRFIEKPQDPKSKLISVGIYIFAKNDIKKIDEFLKSGNIDGPGFLVEYLCKSSDVFGFKIDGKWFDIGSFKSLEDARKEF